jgi:hypothetical protein
MEPIMMSWAGFLSMVRLANGSKFCEVWKWVASLRQWE